MTSKVLWLMLVALLMSVALLYGRGRQIPPQDMSPVVAKVGAYEIRANEFEEGFSSSGYAAREDKSQARREYLDTLIDQKLILLDAQKKGFDKEPDFLRSVERFWAQSLLAVAVGKRSRELEKQVEVRDEDVRRLYEEKVKDGTTLKPLQEVYAQIKWQAVKQQESLLLKKWIDGLRQGAAVRVDATALGAMK